MNLIDDIGNAISRLANQVGYVINVIVTAIVDAITSTVETIAGLFRRFSW